MTVEVLLARLDAVRKVGQGRWLVRCPAHHDQHPSLSIRVTDTGKVLVKCWAGCSQMTVIAALRSLGLWSKMVLQSYYTRSPEGVSRCGPDRERRDQRVDQHRVGDDADERSKLALAIWGSATPATGTLVETYLATRGLRLPPVSPLRFHAGLRHCPTATIWPAMVALVIGVDGTPMGIHRTYLARDGSGKAPVYPARMMLGSCAGGAVRLAHATDLVMVGEGIESCLAPMQATARPVWAALLTSGLRSLELPLDVRDVIVLADGDDAGEAAARECARRWARESRRVRIARPPVGMDFNDVLVGRAQMGEGVRR